MNIKLNKSSWKTWAFDYLLSNQSKHQGEKIILRVAIISYLIHLVLIFLSHQGLINTDLKFLNNPVSAIYTPFSFILIYEVYLLIFYLPQSTSSYIGKQYEIITLIVIRRIFKDIGNLELVPNWFQNANDLQFTFDTFTSLLLFAMIYVYYNTTEKRTSTSNDHPSITDTNTLNFLRLKKYIAIMLVPVLFFLAINSFLTWAMEMNQHTSSLKLLANVNNVFFDEFFTVLIIVDVLLLITSFFYTDKFHVIIRNSGFVISTILIKISFSVEGILNNVMILSSVLFGIAILKLYHMYEKNEKIIYQ
ncbi:MAG: hypothetical protein NBV77_03000 [Bacteroidia bacterium]|nr:hypothetical protein [Bacteroidia bacterium]